MTAALTLATETDFERLWPLVRAFRDARGGGIPDDRLAASIRTLLGGTPHGAIWVLGPRSAPVGYVALSFGWRPSDGGLSATVAEIFVREAVRGRGVGTEALGSLLSELSGSVASVHATCPSAFRRAERFFQRLGFRAGEDLVMGRQP